MPEQRTRWCVIARLPVGEWGFDRDPVTKPPDCDVVTRWPDRDVVAGWFTGTVVCAVVGVFGVVLLPFATGQGFGANVLGAVAESVTSGIGGWLIVAFLALVLIAAAGKNWRTSRH
ncbi:hypothetical protein ACFQE1_07320 [Halobium palmae]|uniref:Uncharacterized protein n=1 Tax=Halobium palmae TaxID=1776492 RepID=A0ABD5RY53_9EURY